MKELIQFIKEFTVSKIKNTLFMYFVVAWLYFNYEVPLTLLFSKEKIESRIDFLDTLSFSIWTDVVCPLTLMILIVLIHKVAFVKLNMIFEKIHTGRILQPARDQKYLLDGEDIDKRTFYENKKLDLKFLEQSREREENEKIALSQEKILEAKKAVLAKEQEISKLASESLEKEKERNLLVKETDQIINNAIEKMSKMDNLKKEIDKVDSDLLTKNEKQIEALKKLAEFGKESKGEFPTMFNYIKLGDEEFIQGRHISNISENNQINIDYGMSYDNYGNMHDYPLNYGLKQDIPLMLILNNDLDNKTQRIDFYISNSKVDIKLESINLSEFKGVVSFNKYGEQILTIAIVDTDKDKRIQEVNITLDVHKDYNKSYEEKEIKSTEPDFDEDIPF